MKMIRKQSILFSGLLVAAVAVYAQNITVHVTNLTGKAGTYAMKIGDGLIGWLNVSLPNSQPMGVSYNVVLNNTSNDLAQYVFTSDNTCAMNINHGASEVIDKKYTHLDVTIENQIVCTIKLQYS